MTRGSLFPDCVATATLLLLTAGGAMTAVATDEVLNSVLLSVAYTLGFGAVGWLLWRRLPHNPIGWCFAGSALASAVGGLGHGWAEMALAGHVRLGTLARLGAFTDTYVWVVAAALGACLPLLLLPDGRLPSPAWRPVPWALLTGCLVGLAGQAAVPGMLGTGAFRDVVNPLGLPQLGALPALLANLAGLAVLLGLCAGAASVVARYRQSSGVHRQQLRWVATGGCCALLGVAISLPAPESPAGLVAGVIAANAVPVSIGIAVLRYRLYDLGRVVSRTVSYVVVTGLLLTVYFALVAAASRVLPAESPLAVAASTLAAAALFQPLRRRVQSAVDHRFNRARYDADRTVEAFRARLREEVDLDAVRAEMLAVTQQALQPASAALWLRSTPERAR